MRPRHPTEVPEPGVHADLVYLLKSSSCLQFEIHGAATEEDASK